MWVASSSVQMDQPLVVLAARGDELKRSPLTAVSGAQVTAFKPSEDGKAWIIRLFGASGKDEQVSLTWAKPEPKTVWLSDASEKPLKQATGAVAVPAWTLITLRAELP